jgi:hypothetical protein
VQIVKKIVRFLYKKYCLVGFLKVWLLLCLARSASPERVCIRPTVAGLAKLQHWLTPQLDGTVNLTVCIFSMDNAWGIVRCVLDIVMQQKVNIICCTSYRPYYPFRNLLFRYENFGVCFNVNFAVLFFLFSYS